MTSYLLPLGILLSFQELPVLTAILSVTDNNNDNKNS